MGLAVPVYPTWLVPVSQLFLDHEIATPHGEAPRVCSVFYFWKSCADGAPPSLDSRAEPPNVRVTVGLDSRKSGIGKTSF